jgi:hypothetical protein
MTTSIRTDADYRVLYRLNEVGGSDALMRILNASGAANLTCCPECLVDDFTHAKGCKLAAQCVLDEVSLDEAAFILPKRPWYSKKLTDGQERARRICEGLPLHRPRRP